MVSSAISILLSFLKLLEHFLETTTPTTTTAIGASWMQQQSALCWYCFWTPCISDFSLFSRHHLLRRAISILLSSLKLLQHFLETTTLPVGAQAILLNFSPSKEKEKREKDKNNPGELAL